MESISQWSYPEPLPDPEDKEASAFSEFLQSNQLIGSSVVCNIEDPSLKIRKIDLPKMPDSDLKEAVSWQLRDVVEGPVSDYFVRYSHLDEFSVENVRRLSLLTYAVKKAAIMSLVEKLKSFSLSPAAVEPTSVTLLSAFDQLQGWKEGEFYGLVDLGQSKSVFTAMGGRKLYFSRPLQGISVGAGREFVGLAVEIQKSIDAFSLMFRKEKIDRLYLSGGGAEIQGLKESLSKSLAIPTSLLGNPPYLYHVALGLASFGS